MSKWLRRGQTTPDANHPDDTRFHEQTSEFPEPPRNREMPAAAAAASSQPMVGYGSSPANIAMDVENPRSKYAPHPQYQGQTGTSSKAYDGRGARSSRGREDPEEGHRSRSSRSSSRGNGSRSRYTQQPNGQHYQTRQGPTSAPNAMTPSQHFSPPAGQFGQRPMATPPPEVQPTFPPPAVTSESPPPSEQIQRRPAYLLHRDLVIGKGSYGQVCIASRGESEGHTNGRSGKRKKFACKCVMLRNDPKYISKLQEEVNVLRELRGHDNVIRLYDVFCVDNELFIITELGRGGDLFHLLTTHPKHGVTEAYAGKSTRMYKTNSNEYDPVLTIVFYINPQPKL
jgi:hypothetical protein